MKKKEIIEKTQELLKGHCCAELRSAAEDYLSAIGTEREEKAAEKYLAELKDGVMPIEGVVEFFASDAAKAAFGEENAKQIFSHAKEIKANGAIWCDCPACSLALEIQKLF